MNTTKDNRTIQPYLFFNGNCEEAIEFYRKALGAEVEMMMRFKESPEPQPPGTVPPGFENKIMHASFRVGQTTVMASRSEEHTSELQSHHDLVCRPLLEKKNITAAT